MNFIIEHWRGEISIARAFWLSGLVAFLVPFPFDLLEVWSFFSINHIHVDDLGQMMLDGRLESLKAPPVFITVADWTVWVMAIAWWSVGTWRACDNPENDIRRTQPRWFTKSMLVLAIALDGLFKVAIG